MIGTSSERGTAQAPTMRWLATLVCLLPLACTEEQPKLQARVLSTGKQIQIISLHRADQATGEPTLSLHYVTGLKIDDRVALEKEVEEIWADLRKEAEAATVSEVIIDVSEAPVSRSRGFVLRRNPDGTWRRSSGFLPNNPATDPPKSAP